MADPLRAGSSVPLLARVPQGAEWDEKDRRSGEWDRTSVAEPALLVPASFAVQSQPPLLAPVVTRLGANADPVVAPELPPLSFPSPVFSLESPLNPGWCLKHRSCQCGSCHRGFELSGDVDTGNGLPTLQVLIGIARSSRAPSHAKAP